MSETRTYRGGSLEELLPRIRAELGDDAVVVRQREGLTGGVAGFFQKRTVEIEARRGQSSLGVEWFAGDPEEDAIVTPSPRFTSVPAEEPAPVPEVTAAAVPTPPRGRRGAAAAPCRPAAQLAVRRLPQRRAACPTRRRRLPTNGVPESVPTALAGDAFPNAEELMRDALAARRAPATPPPRRADRHEPAGRRDPGPGARARRGRAGAEPEPDAGARARGGRSGVGAADARPRRRAPAPGRPSRHARAARGGRPPAGRAPPHRHARSARARARTRRAPSSTTRSCTASRSSRSPRCRARSASQLAARIPVATLSGPAARGRSCSPVRPGSGAPRLVAGIAGRLRHAHDASTSRASPCGPPTAGAALAAALAPLGVPVHAATDGAEAADARAPARPRRPRARRHRRR